ncbi:DUF4383 domain-containing protein [Plantactinospora sp. KBS50]|uniref:DUF4383 domain-containing protein n=1 Tax=Plantactinospora sp. KBS50 TaxID=2024580 RepID=UPI000BAB09E8|nr:DUF4383 domain-containing protein [Plantactinospora sp. KBS50]ASW56868.1 hypothetical protein CIK06_25960 [Plantactinospora sp. KBS50]
MVSGTRSGVAGMAISRSALRSAAAGVAGIFLLLGVLGFVPGITTGYGEMTFAGLGSGARLFGVFQTSILNNILHLLFGLVGLALARRPDGARAYLTLGGVLNLALWIFGLAVEHHDAANFIPVNSGDTWLYLGLGLGMLALGLTLAPRATGAQGVRRRR